MSTPNPKKKLPWDGLYTGTDAPDRLAQLEAAATQPGMAAEPAVASATITERKMSMPAEGSADWYEYQMSTRRKRRRQ